MEPWKAQSDTKSGRGNARNQGLRAMQSFLGELLSGLNKTSDLS